MSLLDAYTEKCTIIDKRTVSDGYGGYEVQYVDGAEIEAAISMDDSMSARVALKEGVKNIYSIVIKKSISLNYGDILRRNTDKKYFRVTSDGDDMKTPDTASIDIRKVSAEEWELPNG